MSDHLTIAVTNATDITSQPRHVALYTTSIAPGARIKVPVHLVDKKVRMLESARIIFLGNTPPNWYREAKVSGSPTREEAIARETPAIVSPPPAAKKVRKTSDTVTKDGGD